MHIIPFFANHEWTKIFLRQDNGQNENELLAEQNRKQRATPQSTERRNFDLRESRFCSLRSWCIVFAGFASRG